MAAHNELGKKGENLAVAWLLEQGYELIHRNWRHARAEVDIITTKESVLHFIEVKSRTNGVFGYPEESITENKIQNLMIAAEEFLYQFPSWKRIQFDVLSININKNGTVEFFLIEDIYV